MLENNKLSYTSQNHLSVTVLKHFVYRWQMNITSDIRITSHDINIEMYLTVSKIIPA